jgi:flagellar L-ring protein precursor FlgH
MLDDAGLHDETMYPATYPVDNTPPPKTNGSIYQSGYEVSLYRDPIANRVGDILTIRLEEQTEGEKQANTKTNKTTLNDTNKGTDTHPILFGGSANAMNFNLGTEFDFNGKGQTDQKNKLHGTISVTVTRVLSNGNLIVQGESWVTINQGREYIRLTGIVRYQDIEPNNTVSSQRVSDARISYSGTGQVGNASRGGFMTQLLTKFFPY